MEKTVVDLILGKIDDLGKEMGQRFDGMDKRLDKVNGRLDTHDTDLKLLNRQGCARFAGGHEEAPPVRTSMVVKQGTITTAIAGSVVAAVEILKAYFGGGK